jgi:hypothetical protein
VNRLEARVRAATRATAEEIAAGTIPPLELNQNGAVQGGVTTIATDRKTPPDLAVRRPVRAWRRTAVISAAAVIVGGAVLAAAALAGGATPSGTHQPPAALAAWSVVKGPNQTISILIRQLRDPAGMQRTLRADGVPAVVAFQGGILSDTPPLPRGCQNPPMSDEANAKLQSKILGPAPGMNVGSKVALTIHTAEIPKGIGLNLTVQASGTSWGWSLGLVLATPACTGS